MSLLTRTKIRPLVAFKVYDMDRDGYISNGELYLVLKMMVGNNLKVRPSHVSDRIVSYPFRALIGRGLFGRIGSATTADC